MAGSIHVRGAREHNLKNVDVQIPRDRLTVITGFRVPASPRWRSTPFMPRASDAMSSCCQRMRGSSSN